MVLRIRITVLLLISFCLLTAQEDSTKITFNGQVTTWGIGQFENPFGIQLAGRFVPTMLGNFNLTPKTKIEYYFALKAIGREYHTLTFLPFCFAGMNLGNNFKTLMASSS